MDWSHKLCKEINIELFESQATLHFATSSLSDDGIANLYRHVMSALAVDVTGMIITFVLM